MKISEYLSIYPNLINLRLDLLCLCNEICKIDNLFPPSDLWIDYYNIKKLEEIIIFPKNKKYNGVII